MSTDIGSEAVEPLGKTSIEQLLERSFACDVLILDENELGESFFRLQEGLLGELFQKFVNYDQTLAIVVSDFAAYGERVAELIREHQTHSNIRFFQTLSEANEWKEDSKEKI